MAAVVVNMTEVMEQNLRRSQASLVSHAQPIQLHACAYTYEYTPAAHTCRSNPCRALPPLWLPPQLGSRERFPGYGSEGAKVQPAPPGTPFVKVATSTADGGTTEGISGVGAQVSRPGGTRNIGSNANSDSSPAACVNTADARHIRHQQRL